MRKPFFCICENKNADQLRGNHEADQRFCFRYTDSTIPLLIKSEILSLEPSCVVVQPGVENPEDRLSQNEAHLLSGWNEGCSKSDFRQLRISTLWPSKGYEGKY